MILGTLFNKTATSVAKNGKTVSKIASVARCFAADAKKCKFPP